VQVATLFFALLVFVLVASAGVLTPLLLDAGLSSTTMLMQGASMLFAHWADGFKAPNRLVYVRTTDGVMVSPLLPIALETGHWRGATAGTTKDWIVENSPRVIFNSVVIGSRNRLNEKNSRITPVPEASAQASTIRQPSRHSLSVSGTPGAVAGSDMRVRSILDRKGDFGMVAQTLDKRLAQQRDG